MESLTIRETFDFIANAHSRLKAEKLKPVLSLVKVEEEFNRGYYFGDSFKKFEKVFFRKLLPKKTGKIIMTIFSMNGYDLRELFVFKTDLEKPTEAVFLMPEARINFNGQASEPREIKDLQEEYSKLKLENDAFQKEISSLNERISTLSSIIPQLFSANIKEQVNKLFERLRIDPNLLVPPINDKQLENLFSILMLFYINPENIQRVYEILKQEPDVKELFRRFDELGKEQGGSPV